MNDQNNSDSSSTATLHAPAAIGEAAIDTGLHIEPALTSVVTRIETKQSRLAELRATEQALLLELEQDNQEKARVEHLAFQSKIDRLAESFGLPSLQAVVNLLQQNLTNARMKAVRAARIRPAQPPKRASKASASRVGVHRHYGHHNRRLTQEERIGIYRDINEPVATRKTIRAISKRWRCSRQTVYSVKRDPKMAELLPDVAAKAAA